MSEQAFAFEKLDIIIPSQQHISNGRYDNTKLATVIQCKQSVQRIEQSDDEINRISKDIWSMSATYRM